MLMSVVRQYREAQKAKELENARKKAEKAELLKKEEESLKSAKTGNAKKAIKKAQTWAAPSLDHDDLNSADLESKKGSTLAASGIENAIDALGLVTGATSNTAIDRHPERRFKAALLAFQEERMPSLIEETPGLRRRQRLELIYKEFTRSDRNPLNQPNAEFDSSKEDLKEIRQRLERDLEEQFTRED